MSEHHEKEIRVITDIWEGFKFGIGMGFGFLLVSLLVFAIVSAFGISILRSFMG